MGTITLPNFRTTADVTMNTRLKDGGVFIDWANLTNIKAWLYSDAQRAIAGRCGVSINQADSTKLVCLYSATKPQYLGVNRLIVQAKYLGQTKTYDVPVFNFVSRTDAATGGITIEEPSVDVCIEVTDTTSSILDTVIAAALAAAADAEHAAHLIPNQVLLDCEAATAVALTAAERAPIIGENGNWWVWNSEQAAYVDTGNEAQGPTGNGIATIVQTIESNDDAGTNVVTVTMTDGTVVTFNVKNGSKGHPGAAQAAYKSVETLPTASADTMDKIYLTPSGTPGVYNMSYTDYDGSNYSWIPLGTTAIQLSDYATKAEFGQLEAEVNGTTETTEVLTPKSLTADKYFNTNVSTMANTPSAYEGIYCTKISVTPGEVYRIKGLQGSSNYTLLFATADSSRARLRRAETGSNTRITLDVTIQEGEAYLYVNLGSYNSETDGVWKVTEVTEHTDGIVDNVQDLETRVTALENAPGANVVDSLDSTSTTDALSANKGRELNEDINGVTTITWEEQEILVGRYCNTSLSRITSKQSLPSGDGVACVYAYVSPGDVFRIYGKGNAAGYQLYAMADADRYIVENGVPGVAMNTRNNPLELTIPEGVARLCVNLYEYDPLTDKVEKMTSNTTECIKTRIAALEAKDIELESQINSYSLPLKGKKVMFFGDSITEFTYNGKGTVGYFADYSGATCFKAAVGGTRFVQRTTPVETPTSNNQAYAALEICNMVKAWCEADYTKQDAACSYLNDYTARVNVLKDNPVNTIDVVIIGGGTNDVTNGSPIGTKTDTGFTTLWGVFNKIVELLLTANPALKIYFYSPVVGYRSNNRTDANWSDNYEYADGTRQEYVALFSQMARHSHIPYIDVYNTLGWNQTNFSQYFIDTDGTHPYKGFDVIARRLYGQIKALME